MFKQRLISGIILVIIAVAALYCGGMVTLGVTAAISFIGVWELLRVIKMEKQVLGITAYIGCAAYYGLLLASKLGNFDYSGYVMPILAAELILMFAVYVFTFPKYRINEVAISYLSVIYVAVMLSYIYLIRELPSGGWLVVLVFLSAWGNDTLAYCTGMLIGKHKMSPVLSPKKTIEGGIGGVVGAGILGFVYGLIAQKYLSVSDYLDIWFAIICAVGGFISIIGDLGASAIKRNYEVKDYSALIPGHGGILDRFDSIIITAPIIYYLLTLVVGL